MFIRDKRTAGNKNGTFVKRSLSAIVHFATASNTCAKMVVSHSTTAFTQFIYEANAQTVSSSWARVYATGGIMRLEKAPESYTYKIKVFKKRVYLGMLKGRDNLLHTLAGP